MGERKGQNKYYPPDFDPAKHGNLNKYHGTHALRERASKIHLGILRIRFEMPFNVWCEGCKNHVAMGVRFNADKKKVGMYYTTPLFEFRMKCHLCDNHFLIRTDPENFDYTCVEGLQRQEKRWDTAAYDDSGHDRAHTAKLDSDAMYKLEHKKDDVDKKAALEPALGQLETVQERTCDDYGANSFMRKIFRTEKVEIKAKTASNKAMLERAQLLGAGIELVPETDDDKRHAKLIAMKMGPDVSERREAARRQLTTESIFDRPSTSACSGASTQATLAAQQRPTAASATDALKRRVLSAAAGYKPAPDTAKRRKAGAPVLVLPKTAAAPQKSEPSVDKVEPGLDCVQSMASYNSSAAQMQRLRLQETILNDLRDHLVRYKNALHLEGRLLTELLGECDANALPPHHDHRQQLVGYASAPGSAYASSDNEEAAPSAAPASGPALTPAYAHTVASAPAYRVEAAAAQDHLVGKTLLLMPAPEQLPQDALGQWAGGQDDRSQPQPTETALPLPAADHTQHQSTAICTPKKVNVL